MNGEEFAFFRWLVLRGAVLREPPPPEIPHGAKCAFCVVAWQMQQLRALTAPDLRP